jgi:Zn-dependent protease
MRDINHFLNNIHLILPAIVLALTFHEFAHAKVADLLGDPTPRREGRLSLNPLDHIDPLGFLMLIFVRFGWAKPVPINPFNFRGDRNRGVILVSLAGPLANLLFAFISTFLLYFSYLGFFGPASSYLYFLSQYLIMYNIYFMLFNLLPIPPLDGSKVLNSILPYNYRYKYYQLEPYAPLILILLLISGLLPVILAPMANSVINFLNTIAVNILKLFF